MDHRDAEPPGVVGGLPDQEAFAEPGAGLVEQDVLPGAPGQQVHQGGPFIERPVGEVGDEVDGRRPADRGRLDVAQPQALRRPADQLIELGVRREGPELVPGAQPLRDPVRADRVQKGQTDAAVAAGFVIEVLPEEAGLHGRPTADPARRAALVGRKPAGRADDQDAGGLVRAVLTPLGPALVRTAGLVFYQELIERDREPRLA